MYLTTNQLQISWFLQKPMIWIYAVCKVRVYPGSAGFKLIPGAYSKNPRCLDRYAGSKSLDPDQMPQKSVCVEVLWPSQPNGVMSSAISLPNHTFTGQA